MRKLNLGVLLALAIAMFLENRVAAAEPSTENLMAVIASLEARVKRLEYENARIRSTERPVLAPLRRQDKAQPVASTMITKAPVVAPEARTWTGIYVGGHFGAGWGNKEWSDPTIGPFTLTSTGNIPSVFPPFAVLNFTGNSGTEGFLGGGQVGINYQIDRVVVGIEGDFSGANLKGSGICSGDFMQRHIPTFFGAVGLNCSNKTQWTATLTGRLGFTALQDRLLLYAKGGAAWARNQVAIAPTVFSGPAVPPASQFVATESSHGVTRTGWNIGTGAEYGFAPNWSARIGYDYLDFGTSSEYFEPSVRHQSF